MKKIILFLVIVILVSPSYHVSAVEIIQAEITDNSILQTFSVKPVPEVLIVSKRGVHYHLFGMPDPSRHIADIHEVITGRKDIFDETLPEDRRREINGIIEYLLAHYRQQMVEGGIESEVLEGNFLSYQERLNEAMSDVNLSYGVVVSQISDSLSPSEDELLTSLEENELVIINYYASWCQVCAISEEVITAAIEKYEDSVGDDGTKNILRLRIERDYKKVIW